VFRRSAQVHKKRCTSASLEFLAPLEDTVAIDSPFNGVFGWQSKLNPISSEAFLSILGNRW
jgi:hypothetical protein